MTKKQKEIDKNDYFRFITIEEKANYYSIKKVIEEIKQKELTQKDLSIEIFELLKFLSYSSNQKIFEKLQKYKNQKLTQLKKLREGQKNKHL